MAIFHLSVKPISRGSGRSSTGAAAYRSASKIVDVRTGVVHDYRRKGGVLHSELILPGGGTADRAEFWNDIEVHHKRGDAVLVREVEIALPAELEPGQRQALAVGFAKELADRYQVAADIALHAPRTVTARELEKQPGLYFQTDPATGRKHNGNWHCHIMLSACHVGSDGELGKKAVELDPIHCQRHKIENMADRERERWAQLVNTALASAGQGVRVDHRSLKEQGVVDRLPGVHLGPEASEFERRTGEPSRLRLGFEAEIGARLARAAALGELERQSRELERSIIDLSSSLAAARLERDRQAQAVPAPVFRLNPKMFPKLAKSAAVSVVQVEAPPPPAAVAQQSAPVIWEWYRGGYANSVEVDDENAVEKVDQWHQRRLGWLAQRYKDPDLQKRLKALDLDIQWVSFPKAGDQVAALKIRVGGATVVDDGRALVVEGGKSAAAGAALAQRAALMVEIAKAKGWGQIKVNGDPQFVAAVRAAADDAGLGVSAVNGKTTAARPRGPGM